MPVAPLVLVLAAMASSLGNGCPSVHGSGPRSAAPREAQVGSFRAVDGDAPAPPSTEDLLEQALAGVVEDPEGSLGSRMQLRTLRVPATPRGATSRFNFGDGQRGWVTALPREDVLTSAAYADGKVFIGGGFASHRFFAFDAFTGDLDWSLAAPDGGPTAAILDRGRVIFNTESCTIFVADADTGELMWKRWLGDPLMSQPAVGGDLVLSAYPVSGGHSFGAFRLADGEPAWTVPIPADVIQAPHVNGDSVYFATMDGSVFRLRLTDGHILWKRDVGASSATWVDGDHLLLSRRLDEVRESFEQSIVLSSLTGRIERRGDRLPAPYLTGASRDRQMASAQSGAWGTVPHGSHLGLSNVASGWAFQGSSPAVADGRAYVAVGAEIEAREVATGERVWSRSYGDAEGAQAVSPPAIVGSLLVYGTVDGHLYFSDIDTGLTVSAYDVGEPIVFQPIVAQGWVYVATGRGRLIGLEVGDARLDGWHMWGGNAGHNGPVESAGEVDPALLASLTLPGEGTMQVGAFEETEEATDATAAPATPEETLVADEAPDLPLLDTRVRADVSGPVARVTVTQRFTNPHDRPIEGLYLFPLPADSAVDDMEMRVGDRVIRGRIRRRQQARREYQEARESGKRAALLEQQRPNLFAQRAANIAPGETIEVRIQYVQMLPFSDGGYELSYPMVAAPRYTPDDPGATLGDPGETRRSRSVDLQVSVDAGLPIDSVASPTHRVEIERPGASLATVALAEASEPANRDFVLRYRLAGETPQAALFSHGADGEGHFSLVVQPPAAPSEASVAPRHITFVVDTSSSMRGAPMTHARAVLARALTGLREEDRFNVLTFSDRVESFSASAAPGTTDQKQAAIAFVSGIRAVGSTEMVPAIRQALVETKEQAEDRLPIVALMTDGYIGNEADVLRAIASDLGETRLYALGVGSAVNRFLLERASEVGRGRALVSTLSEPPEAVADRFASYIERPVFTDVTIDWGGLEVSDVYPRRLPDLFAGQPLVVHGRFGEGGSAEVRVEGTVGGRRYARVIEASLQGESADETQAAHTTLWARAAVKDRMQRLYLRDDPTLIEEVTQLGLAHRMVTQWTSFVAVEETVADESEASEEARATVTPGRSLPGDPEIRIPAPANALSVTILLPFGETLVGEWESTLGQWTARFLIPADAEEGTYPIDILVTHADGTPERLRVWYTVDASAPVVEVELVGEARPGAEVTLRATQLLSDHDLLQVGRARDQIEPARAQLLQDARRMEARLPWGEVADLHVVAPGVWETRVRIPDDAEGALSIELVVVDLAANVRSEQFEMEVLR